MAAFRPESEVTMSPSTGSSVDVRVALVQAVDEALLVPGEIVRTAIYERIERSYQVRREDIPEKVEAFHKALEELLGSSAKVMEKIIAKSFYTRLGMNFTEHANCTLMDYVNHVKKARVSDWDTGRIQTGHSFVEDPYLPQGHHT